MPSSAVQFHSGPFTSALCFVGTQIPVKTLFVHILKGETLDEYLEKHPSITPNLAFKVLEDSYKSLLTQ